MSLKSRLRIAILSLVLTIVLALSALNLHNTIEESFSNAQERAELIAEQVKSYTLERIRERAALEPSEPVELNARKNLWYKIVREDRVLPRILEKTMSNSSGVIEILIVTGEGQILAASSPGRAGQQFQPSTSLADWQTQGLWQRLYQVLRSSSDYVVTAPLGVPQQSTPVLTVKVFVSSVLLREAVEPKLRELGVLSFVSLLLCGVLAILVSNVVSGSLVRISRNIELISKGDVSRAQADSFESKEFADVQSKLTSLGREFHGAKQDALNLRSNIDQMLRRLEEAVLLFDPNGRLRMAGQPAERLLARNREDLIGRTFEQIFPAWTSLGAAIQQAVQFGMPIHDRPVVLERPNMPAAKLLVSVELVDHYPEKNPGTLITIKDAETRRQIETQLDTSHRLAAISRITSGVAHEIKNPLNAITLHLEVAKSKAGKLPDGVSAELDIISREIQRLDRVVKTLLDFNRPLDLQMSECNLEEVTREVAELVSPQAQTRRVQVEVTPGRPEPSIIVGDRDLLKQALLNVAMNGIEAMTGDGKLEMRISRKFDDYVVSIADQGGGIPAEMHDKIFNLYFSTKPEGSGIGLAVTFRVVQLHNGTIHFDSEVGRGTCFHLHFPAPKRQQEVAFAS
jgi:Signal transduction histidine kinase involved in nitrogen fixation and metabolism regulation